MKLDLDSIFESQTILDKTVQTKHGVSYSRVYEELKLALFVELGELANEVRCFKFWSIKGPSEKGVILEEYVDGIHFICSLSIAKNASHDFFIPDKIELLNKADLTICFNKLFSRMPSLNDAVGINNWFKDYLMLGYHLGFTYDDIYKAYFAKNQINFKRQEENY